MLRQACELLRHGQTPARARLYRTGIRGSPLTVDDSTLVLGIESSADDSAAAVMDASGRVLGECVLSQFRQHRAYGGIWPDRARELHEANLPRATATALERAGRSMRDISAVAFTIGPGLAPCLGAGRDWCQSLAEEHGVALLPVHHMHAHALTARLCTRSCAMRGAAGGAGGEAPSEADGRQEDSQPVVDKRPQERRDTAQTGIASEDMQQQQAEHQQGNEQNGNACDDEDQVTFPFLVLLVSGGHCTFAVAEDVATFKVLGAKRCKNTPGEVLDKSAYLLRLHLVPGLEAMAPGAAIETAAAGAADDADARTAAGYTWPKSQRRDCSTEFRPFLLRMRDLMVRHDRGDADVPVPGYEGLAADLQTAMMSYVASIAERAMLYCSHQHPDVRHVVVSGGVGANSALRRLLVDALRRNALPWRLVAPPPRLCTDNGVMIAWTGLEYMRAGIPPLARSSIDGIWFEPRLRIGEDVSDLVAAARIHVPLPKLFLK